MSATIRLPDGFEWAELADAADGAGVGERQFRRWIATGLYVVMRPGPTAHSRPVFVAIDSESRFPVKRAELDVGRRLPAGKGK